MANVQQSNIAAGTPPNFMLPPYQADRSGQPVSISVSYQSWVPQERRTWEHLARHSWSPPCRGITGDLGRSQAWSSGPSELMFFIIFILLSFLFVSGSRLAGRVFSFLSASIREVHPAMQSHTNRTLRTKSLGGLRGGRQGTS